MRIVGYCIIPIHRDWHLLLWQIYESEFVVLLTAKFEQDGDVSSFMQWISATHAKRYHGSGKNKYAVAYLGMGHIYQGRFNLVLC